MVQVNRVVLKKTDCSSMAFSKAKILRFNDIQSCAPPPGAYTPKFDNHVLGSVVYNKDNSKPTCPESPTSSCSDVNSINSTTSVPTFRTPTIPRRRKRAMTHSLGAKSNIFSLTDENSEELREKIVECVNKDETIKDLEYQIEELKLFICDLKIEKKDLIQNKEELLIDLKNMREKLEFMNKQLSESNVEKQTKCDELTTLKAELKDQNIEQMKQLQANVTLQSECDEIRNKLCTEHQEKEKYKKEFVAEKQRCEMTLNSTQEQIETLKHDLLISQQNLAQLTMELKNLESAKLEIRQQRDSLKTDKETLKNDLQTDQTKIAELQTKIQNKDIQIKELQSFSSDQKEMCLIAQSLVTQVKNEMQKLEEKIVDYQFKEQRKEQEIDRVKQDLILQSKGNANQIKEISTLRNIIVLKEGELQQCLETRTTQQTKITDLTLTLKERELEMNDVVRSFKKQKEDYMKFEEIKLNYEVFINKCKEYEKIIAEQNALIGPFREQLERFEEEHKILLAHKKEAENEAKEMGLKYAEIAGHQNHKQKLKHMMDLKKKNINLVEQKHDYETQLWQKNRTIEKLQNKIAQLTANNPKVPKETNKENVCVNSPTALKERN